MNQRISPRKTFQSRVVFTDEFGSDFLYFISKDISTSGLFILTDLHIKPKTKVMIKFSLYEDDKAIHTTAEVTRFVEERRGPGRKKNIAKGIGLKFLGLNETDFIKIQNFVLET